MTTITQVLPFGRSSKPGFVARLRTRLAEIRRSHFPTQEELDYDYLSEAGDLYDLEARFRKLALRNAQKVGP